MARHKRRMDKIDILIARIAERLEELELSERQASIAATGGPDALRYIRTRRAMPSAARLERIARVLGATPAYLLGAPINTFGSPQPEVEHRDAEAAYQSIRDTLEKKELSFQLPPRRDPFPEDLIFTRDRHLPFLLSYTYDPSISVYDFIEQDDAEVLSVDQGQVEDWAPRPPALAGRRDLFAIFYWGSDMKPAWEPGSAVVFDPARQGNIGDYVFVVLGVKGERDGPPRQEGVFRRLVKRSPDFLELEQLSPHRAFRVPVEEVVGSYRAMSVREILGA